MNSKNCIKLGIFLLFTLTVNGQASFNILNASKVEDIGKIPETYKKATENKPVPYGYINERDILWSKVTWEHIDLNEKINMTLYYPIDTLNVSPNRRSLFDTLLKAIRDGDIKEVYEDSFFRDKLTMNDIEQKLSRVDTSDYAFDLLNEGETNIDEYIDKISLTAQDIEGYEVKGMWYFDKRHGEMRYRLLAIAPVSQDVQTKNRDDVDNDELLPLFWVFYPDARNVLHKNFAFNDINPRSPISFDELLNARRFSSLIIREENIYSNRSIAEYIQGNALYRILESERIREEIRNKELDMWNY